MTPSTRAKAPAVMLLITTFDIGGAERVYVELARGLVSRGYRVIAAALQGRSGTVARELAASGVQIVDLHMRSKADVFAVWRLVQVLRNPRVSVLYTFLIHAHLIGRTAARLAGTPVILSSQQIMSWESKVNEWLNRHTARWCSAVVGVSQNVTRYLVGDVGLPPEKVVTIYNCVDVSRFRRHRPPAALGREVIGSIARLYPEKDHPTLLHAFARLQASRPGLRLVLAGAGPERPRLEALAASLGIAEHVEFLGHVDDVRSVHERLTVFAQISHVEGLPVAVLEAMAAGLPVVASRVGGNEEAVVDGLTGLLVPPRDVEALTAALQRVIEDAELQRRMGEAATRRAEEVFGAHTMVATTDALIRRLLTGAAVPSAN